MKTRVWKNLSPKAKRKFVTDFMWHNDGDVMVVGRSQVESDYLESISPFTTHIVTFNKREHLVVTPEYAGPIPKNFKALFKRYEHEGKFNPVILPLDIKVRF